MNKFSVVISLGFSCNTSIAIKKLGLRKFSLPFDYLSSFHFESVIHIIESRFYSFMLRDNLKYLYVNEGNNSYVFEDTYYGIRTVHDLLTNPENDYFKTYKEFIDRMNRRINRFFYVLENANNILFIREHPIETDNVHSDYFMKVVTNIRKEKTFKLYNIVTSSLFNTLESSSYIKNFEKDNINCISVDSMTKLFKDVKLDNTFTLE